MTPQTGLRFFSFVPVSLASKTLDGLFELTQCLSGASISHSGLLPGIYKNWDTLWTSWSWEDSGDPRTLRIVDKTLILCLKINHFFTPFLDCKKSQQNQIELVTRLRQPTGLWASFLSG